MLFGEGCIYSSNGALSLSESLTPWILSSKRYDPETEFTFFGFRYYSSNMGRFITPDPIGFADGPNLYAYVRNNPFLYHDPHGLFISDFFKGFASTGLQAIGFRLAVMGVGVFCPPAAVAINVAATCYSVYGLATLGVSVGSYVVNSAIDDGWQGAGSVLYNIGHSFTEAGFLGGVVGSMASGKVKFSKGIRATHGGLVLDTTSKTNSFVKSRFLNQAPAQLEKYFVRNPNQINHIMQKKHAWDKLIPLTGNKEKDFAKVLQLLEEHQIRSPAFLVEAIEVFPELKITRFEYTKSIAGLEVKAIFNRDITNKISLEDAWVITK